MRIQLVGAVLCNCSLLNTQLRQVYFFFAQNSVYNNVLVCNSVVVFFRVPYGSCKWSRFPIQTVLECCLHAFEVHVVRNQMSKNTPAFKEFALKVFTVLNYDIALWKSMKLSVDLKDPLWLRGDFFWKPGRVGRRETLLQGTFSTKNGFFSRIKRFPRPEKLPRHTKKMRYLKRIRKVLRGFVFSKFAELFFKQLKAMQV